MEITIRKHRRNLSYDEVAALDELWVTAKHFEQSFRRERKDHWDGRSDDEYIVITDGICPTVNRQGSMYAVRYIRL